MKYLILAAFTLLTMACMSVPQEFTETIEPVTEDISIDRGKVEMARVELKVSAGELDLRGGAEKLLEGNIRYNAPSLKPAIRYDDTSFRGHLTIDQGAAKIHGKMENVWNLKVNNEVPLDLIVNMGAGENRLNLGSLTLRRLEVHMGVGKMDLDLRGKPKKDYDVEVRGGVGEANIRIPSEVGVSIQARGGIGEISNRGLKKDGSNYVNSLYGNSDVTVRIDIQGGIGQINLIAD